MARKKDDPNGTPAPATTTSADGTVITAAPATTAGRKRGPNDPETTIGWDGQRDAVLVQLLLQNPGQLTTAKVAETLKTSPAFASDLKALAQDSAPEKIRQRVKKLNVVNEAEGWPLLRLKHKTTAGYDVSATLAAIYGQMGIQKTQGQAQAPVAPIVAPQPVFQAPAPAPSVPGVLNTLIPT